MNTSSVALVHAYILFREGLRRNLSSVPGFQVVGEASNGQQAIQVVSETEPDIVLIDMDLPGINGLEVARVIKRGHPHISIVLLSPSLDSQSVVKAIRAGVAACLLGNVSWDDMLQTFHELRKGNYPINDLIFALPDVATQVLDAFRQLAMDQDAQHVYSPLSPRELQVLKLVANNQTNKEIASALDISNQTVKNHISSILRKLAVNDRTQAVIYAVRQGWISRRVGNPASSEHDKEIGELNSSV